MPRSQRVEEFGRNYDDAVRCGDREKTYSMRDEAPSKSSARRDFSREEWFQNSERFADNGEVNYTVKPVDHAGTSTEYLGVTLMLTYEDGTSTTCITYFVHEDGQWKHRFGQEKTDLFMPDIPCEEFVQAQQ